MHIYSVTFTMSGYTTLSFQNLSYTKDNCSLDVSGASPTKPVTVFTPGASGDQGCVIPTLGSLSASDWGSNRMLISGVSQSGVQLAFSFFYYAYPTTADNAVPVLMWTTANFAPNSSPPSNNSTFVPLTSLIGPFQEPAALVIEGVNVLGVTQGAWQEEPPPPMMGIVGEGAPWQRFW